jgi:hypothetical protein
MGQRGIRGQNTDPTKKDRQSAQRLRDEVAEEIRGGAAGAQVRGVNRDSARGDWDRTGRHHDEYASRNEELPEERPEALYDKEE